MPQKNYKGLSDIPVISLEATPGHRTQPLITCSKLTTETLEQGVKYLQS